ncbi:TonB-dependent receptor domain-containing protein [Halomonas sp. N3-2A]|uniref:TonB-dependent receptor domain-containing protein n=1 Tax=Halomonas sp. N3-2A TaxID=2014541 RepID=UPI000B5B2D39|nr:TonB-dependent receptor [Halomonas sp. N3-2A]ASK20382.1 TonB-dependent receptor [Halomonas sp. N3-2A]
MITTPIKRPCATLLASGKLIPLSSLILGGLMLSQAQAQTNNTELSTLTVTSAAASGYAVDPANAPASISVITKEELEGRSFRDITEALESVPGVYFDDGPSGKGGTGEISIRGMDTKYTLILVDGVPQGSQQAYYNGYGSGAEFGWLPPISAIERIEVIRGPMSTLYGSDALGGVINVITQGARENWGGSVNVDTMVQQDSASGDRHQSQFRVSGPLIEDTLAATITGSVLTRDEDTIEDGYRGYDRRDLTAQLDWTPNDANRLQLEAGYGTQDTEGTTDKTGNANELETRRQQQSLRHTLQWGDRLTTRSYLQRTELRQDDTSYRSVYERLTANTSTVIPLSDHLLTLGAQAREQRTENPGRGFGKANLERWDMALFAEDEWFLTDQFSLTTGARWVNDENYGSEIVPRLYGVFNATPQLTLKGGVSAGYRTPDLKEGDSNWIEGGGGPRCADCRDVGNTNLEAEKSTTYELSALWQSESGLELSTTLFHTDYRDKIEKPTVCDTREGDALCLYQGQEYTAIAQYMNVDEATVNGAELTLDIPIGEHVSLSTSYTFTDSKQRSGENSGLPLNDQPRHRATLGLDWEATADTQLWSQARYKGEAEQIAGRRGLSRAYPSYTLVDVGIRHQLSETVSIYGGIYNLLDKDINFDDYGRLLDGRRFNAGLNVTF